MRGEPRNVERVYSISDAVANFVVWPIHSRRGKETIQQHRLEA
jgi:hypothetical protein